MWICWCVMLVLDDEIVCVMCDVMMWMLYDDGELLIDVCLVWVKWMGCKSVVLLVMWLGILKFKVAALREIDEATRGDEEVVEVVGEVEDDDGWL